MANVEVVKRLRMFEYVCRPVPVGFILVRVLDNLGDKIRKDKEKQK